MRSWLPLFLTILVSFPLAVWQLTHEPLTPSKPSPLLSDAQLSWLNDLARLIQAENNILNAHWLRASELLGDRVAQKQNATWLLNKMHRYGLWENGVPTEISDASITELLTLMAPVPASIPMAQAILSSDWGQTDQARVANNLFNVRCYTPECGMIDSQLAAHTQWRLFRDKKSAIQWFMEKALAQEEFSGFRRQRFKMLQHGAQMPGQWYEASLPSQLSQVISRYHLSYWDNMALSKSR